MTRMKRSNAADELLFGINANVELVGKQVVVGALRAVFVAQEVSTGKGFAVWALVLLPR